MIRSLAVVSSLLVAVFGTGCASVSMPAYSPAINNVQALKNAGNGTAKVGTFASAQAKENLNPLSIRSHAMTSPYENSFANYVAEAIKQELSLAKRYAADAGTEITGTLLKNDVDVSGFSTGSADISARFIVSRAGQITYDQIKSIHHEFPSSFAGAVAIPRGVQEYAVAVQNLLSQLYADSNFAAALK